MDDDRGTLLAVVRSLIDHFERSGIDYAFGGAIAYSAWAEPRATRDVDLNVWVELGEITRAFDVLEAAGVTVDREDARDEARRRGMFVCRHGPYRVDVFVPSVPFYGTALERRVRTRIESRATWVLSPETLAVFKLLFYRPKDLADLGRLLEIQGERFDAQFVRRELVGMMGDDDERVSAWDDLVRRHSGVR